MVLRFLQELIENKISVERRVQVKKMLDFAGLEIKPEEWIAKNTIYTLFFSIVIAILPLIFQEIIVTNLPFLSYSTIPYLSLLVFVLMIILSASNAYFSVYYKIVDRRVRTKKNLPEFLSVVSMNLESGMEPLSALSVSSRSEFAPISDEMKKVRSLTLGHASVSEQLSLLRSRIDSHELNALVSIIERATKAGGDLIILLRSLSADLRIANELDEELKTATQGYVYFISFLIIVGIPLLLSVSSIFVSMIVASGIGGIGVESEGILPVGMFVSQGEEAKFISENINFVFIFLLIVSSVSASLMFGTLWGGEIRQGAKYIPILIILSISSYFILKNIVFGILQSFGL